MPTYRRKRSKQTRKWGGMAPLGFSTFSGSTSGAVHASSVINPTINGQFDEANHGQLTEHAPIKTGGSRKKRKMSRGGNSRPLNLMSNSMGATISRGGKKKRRNSRRV